jgi:hypothetical protein
MNDLQVQEEIMAKATHGSARHGATKKKAKRRPELPSVPRSLQPTAGAAPVQSPDEVVSNGSSEAAPRFRPKAEERRPARSVGGKVVAPAKVGQQVVDYRYAYSDMRVIGVLSAVLFGALLVIYLIIR